MKKEETDFEKGYNEAFSYIRNKFEEQEVGPEIMGFIDSLYRKPVEPVKEDCKPRIYFTAVDKKGNLVYDKEKTRFYATHSEDLEAYMASQENEWNEFMEWKKARKNTKAAPTSYKKLVKVTDPKRFSELIKLFAGKKTPEMCNSENKLIFAEADIKGQTPAYWNTLGQQIMQLCQDDRNAVTMFNICNIDPNAPDAMQQVLDQAASEGFLFDMV